MAPQVGLEPTTDRLTADCSTTELLRNNIIILTKSMLFRNNRPATSYSHRGEPPTTIGAEELNFRVRDGNGCDLFAIVTGLFSTRQYLLYHVLMDVASVFYKIINFVRSKLNKTDIVLHESG